MTAIGTDIRPLGLTDLNAVDEIEQRAYKTPWSRSMFASELAKSSSVCLGAFDGERLIGYVINSRYVDAWHIMNVAVDPDYRRRGIATRLLEQVFESTRDDQRRGYTLEVRVSNDRAISLYEKLGFERQGIRRGYYTDNREDALIMWKDPSRPWGTTSSPRALLRWPDMNAAPGLRRAKPGSGRGRDSTLPVTVDP